MLNFIFKLKNAAKTVIYTFLLCILFDNFEIFEFWVSIVIVYLYDDKLVIMKSTI